LPPQAAKTREAIKRVANKMFALRCMALCLLKG
jgi:hypothetical protein